LTQHTTKVFGPPGTGKTTWLVAKLQSEIAAGTPLSRVAYLTHTRAASEVVAQRVGATKKDHEWFRTVHSACSKRLGLSRENIVDVVDLNNFFKETGLRVISQKDDDQIEYGGWYVADNYGPVLDAYDFSRVTGMSLRDVIRTKPPHPSLDPGRAEQFLEEWEKYKQEQALFDFGDMLTKYLASDIGPLPVDVVFLDEGQDLSNLQWDVFRKLIAAAKRVYIAGDDDQAIYGFMGGSEFGFLEYPADENVILAKSYRVPRPIGERATAVIRRVARRMEKNVEWRKGDGTVEQSGLAIQNLPWRGWLDAKKSVLVLTRHRRGAADVSHDLQSVYIPHSLGKHALYVSAEARAMRDFLLMRDGKKIGWRRAVKMLERAGCNSDKARALGLANKDAEVGRDAFDHIAWNDPDWALLFAEGTKKDVQRVRQIEEIIAREGLDVVDHDPLIQVMTMHAAKGREADIVVLVPDCNDIVLQNVDTATEIRLAYVALTRAKQRVLVLAPLTSRSIRHLTEA
jgi:superfamily I DNA/RNA helicase